MILADAVPSVPAADPMRWVEAGIAAFRAGGWAILIGGAVMLVIYWRLKFGPARRPKGE